MIYVIKVSFFGLNGFNKSKLKIIDHVENINLTQEFLDRHKDGSLLFNLNDVIKTYYILHNTILVVNTNVNGFNENTTLIIKKHIKEFERNNKINKILNDVSI